MRKPYSSTLRPFPPGNRNTIPPGALAAGTVIRNESIMADPQRPDAPIRETTTEARAGSTPGVARNVLVFGTLLVVILFVIIFLVGRP